MIHLFFILIYLITIAIFLIICYYDNKNYIHNIGDLLDETEHFMWVPFINTGIVVIFGLCLCISTLWKLSKLNILWEKFRHIKLR